MQQVSEISTKSVKELANAVNGKWESKVGPRCRYTVQGHVAFVECVGDIAQYELPVKPFGSWFAIGSNPGGWVLYAAIIQ